MKASLSLSRAVFDFLPLAVRDWLTYQRLRTIQRRESSMTQQASNKAALITPVDLAKDQVTEARRVLREMNDRADRAIDSQDIISSKPVTSRARPIVR
jgi:hypothetical protein